MWHYYVFTIPTHVAQSLPDQDLDRITEISAFSKYLHKNPLAVYPHKNAQAFMLIDADDEIDEDEITSLGFTYEHEFAGDCHCCRGTRTGTHEPEKLEKGELH